MASSWYLVCVLFLPIILCLRGMYLLLQPKGIFLDMQSGLPHEFAWVFPEPLHLACVALVDGISRAAGAQAAYCLRANSFIWRMQSGKHALKINIARRPQPFFLVSAHANITFQMLLESIPSGG